MRVSELITASKDTVSRFSAAASAPSEVDALGAALGSNAASLARSACARAHTRAAEALRTHTNVAHARRVHARGEHGAHTHHVANKLNDERARPL
eukprot:2517989-Pleurochrysis_carterae.AAC.1